LKEKESLKYETLLAKIPNHTTGNKKSQPVNAAAYISRFRPQTAMMVFSLDFCLCRFVRGPSAVENG
jgi:hypothetical protein